MDGDGAPQLPLSINQNTLVLQVAAAAVVGAPCELGWGNAGGAVPLLTDLSAQFTVDNQAVTVAADTPASDVWIDVRLDLHTTRLIITGQVRSLLRLSDLAYLLAVLQHPILLHALCFAACVGRCQLQHKLIGD